MPQQAVLSVRPPKAEWGRQSLRNGSAGSSPAQACVETVGSRCSAMPSKAISLTDDLGRDKDTHAGH